LAPGRLVRLTLAPAPLEGVWRATALVSGQSMPEDRDHAEVEGRITAFISPTNFAVNGLPVDASGVPGSTTGLALGVEVEVRGTLRGGVLVASRVDLEVEGGGPEPFELNGSIESVDAVAMHFIVRGVTVMWGMNTLFEDGTTATDIRAGRRVEVKGRLSADGLRIEATSIHIEL
jgi:hypothetical protein